MRMEPEQFSHAEYSLSTSGLINLRVILLLQAENDSTQLRNSTRLLFESITIFQIKYKSTNLNNCFDYKKITVSSISFYFLLKSSSQWLSYRLIN